MQPANYNWILARTCWGPSQPSHKTYMAPTCIHDTRQQQQQQQYIDERSEFHTAYIGDGSYAENIEFSKTNGE